MKRDMDLIREMLLKFEESEAFSRTDFSTFTEQDFPDRDPKLIVYHIALLTDAGLIFGGGPKMLNGHVYTNGLTWQGCEFLETIRDEEVWRKTKAGAKKVGSFSIDVLTDLAKGFVRKKIEQHTGVEMDL